MPQDRFTSEIQPNLTEFRSTGLIAAGGNLTLTKGTPAQTIVEAINFLHRDGVAVTAVSRFFDTPCFPAEAGPDYVNAAIAVATNLTAHDLLTVLHGIENRFGRRREQRWGMRTLDLDLIALDDTVLPDPGTVRRWIEIPPADQIRHTPPDLILPHPRLQDRAFVLVPLMDIAPQWRHPVLGKTIATMYAALPEHERAAVTPA